MLRLEVVVQQKRGEAATGFANGVDQMPVERVDLFFCELPGRFGEED